jgi:hypothetical protein
MPKKKRFRQERWRKNQSENNREQFYERQREAYKNLTETPVMLKQNMTLVYPASIITPA